MSAFAAGSWDVVIDDNSMAGSTGALVEAEGGLIEASSEGGGGALGSAAEKSRQKQSAPIQYLLGTNTGSPEEPEPLPFTLGVIWRDVVSSAGVCTCNGLKVRCSASFCTALRCTLRMYLRAYIGRPHNDG